MFKLQTEFDPRGDQPKAIEKLTRGIKEGKQAQVLLGVTGSGKTFTMANIVAQVNQPTLVLAHNKTLAAQLYQEFKAFFPENAVEYFVSYYDYYQPEAYIPRTDTYIEKDLAINDQIDKMRLSATRSLIERDDVLIVSSVSCIYGLGLPEYYDKMKLAIKVGEEHRRDEVLFHLVEMRYDRKDIDLGRGHFRVRGDVLEIIPAYEEDLAYRIEFFGDEIDRISQIDPLTGKTLKKMQSVTIYPGSHHVSPEEVRYDALETIAEELVLQSEKFGQDNKLVEKQRIEQRTKYDMEMIKELGYCKGIENYSRHFSKRKAGAPPPCLLDYFPNEFLLFIDESHQTLPQVHAMYNGDRARKNSLIEFGFRLPSAFDNRPLKFEEFYRRINQAIFVSATPGTWEVEEAGGEVVEQIVRPTGLLDPVVSVKPAENQVDDVLAEIQKETEKGGRILVTTLTKRLAEDLTKYLEELGLKAKYLHSDIVNLERMQIIQELRPGTFDVLVGINLLREGLDIPEVSLVTILDADKEGYLRSETSLIQTCVRTARNAEGRVIMYADNSTGSIQRALDTMQRRRTIQQDYNREHNITPTTVKGRAITDLGETFFGKAAEIDSEPQPILPEDITQKIKECEKQMRQAAKDLRFEDAARYRDLLHHYQNRQLLEDF